MSWVIRNPEKTIFLSLLALIFTFFNLRFDLPGYERVFLYRLDRARADGENPIPIQSLTNFEWDEGCAQAISYGEGNVPPYYRIHNTVEEWFSIKELLKEGFSLIGERSTDSGDWRNWRMFFINRKSKEVLIVHQGFNFPMPYNDKLCFGKDAELVHAEK